MSAPKRRRPVFHSLTVSTVERLTDDSVVVGFRVSEELRDTYAFTPGQHLTVRRFDAGTELRRSYSICSTPAELAERGEVRIGVRELAGGAFSTYVCGALRRGDAIDVLPPLGHFTTAADAARQRHYAAMVAGSGITPVLSLMATTLEVEEKSRFTLLYGNRRAATVMFADELADLKDRYPGRVHVVHVLSREPQLSLLLSGRLDAGRLRGIIDAGLVDPGTVDEWFLCGPYEMVLGARAVLAERGVPDASIHTELFHVEAGPAPVRAADAPPAAEATVTILLDGRESTFGMSSEERVLDAALRVRSELPYACKGGVCSTCRARLLEGEVRMAQNYALEPDELAVGYVLTCQSTPVTQTVKLDYDA